jgi:hypothetical protein
LRIDEGDGMAAQLNHTIVWSSDQTASARFLAEMLGRPAPIRFGHFDVVELDNGVSLDFANAEGPIRPQHYAFLVSEADFDAVLSRIRKRGLEHWADPMRHRPGEINHNDGGASTSPTPMAITWKLSPGPTAAVPAEPAASG